MSRSVSGNRRSRRQVANLWLFRMLEIAGLALTIVCLLFVVGIVLLEARNYFLGK